jgi:hypothetical protein
MTRPYIKRWPEALAVMAHPTNSIMSFTQLGKLVDDIWFYAGDKSPDVRKSRFFLGRWIEWKKKIGNGGILVLKRPLLDELVHQASFFGCCVHIHRTLYDPGRFS